MCPKSFLSLFVVLSALYSLFPKNRTWRTFKSITSALLGTIWSAGASGKSHMERDSERSAEELGRRSWRLSVDVTIWPWERQPNAEPVDLYWGLVHKYLDYVKITFPNMESYQEMCLCHWHMKRLMEIPVSNRRLTWKYQKPAFYPLASRSVGCKKTTNGWLSIRKRILNSYLNWTMIKVYLLVYLTVMLFFFFLVNRIWGAYPFDLKKK